VVVVGEVGSIDINIVSQSTSEKVKYRRAVRVIFGDDKFADQREMRKCAVIGEHDKIPFRFVSCIS
jgi:hypothetical protein